MKPCVRVREIELPDGKTKRVFTIRVNKDGDPTCMTCWAIYKISLGTQLVCRWCLADTDMVRFRKKSRINLNRPASQKVRDAFQRFAGPLPIPISTPRAAAG